jgi:serine/threonine protein phosphatase PrpC
LPASFSRNDWLVSGVSVQGASHIRRGVPNQDAITWWPTAGSGDQVVLTVCDGHGSRVSFRSDRGSQLAAQAGIGVAQDLIRLQADSASATGRHGVQDEIGRMLVRRWLSMVEEDLNQNPVTLEELEALENDSGVNERKKVEENPRVAYGTTSLGLVATESALACWQLGDGDIVAVSAGDAWRPLPQDKRQMANETFSLSSTEAWRYVRADLLPVHGVSPSLIVLATDGVSNSFADDGGFLKFNSDLAVLIASHGLTAVSEKLELWLREFSNLGSGDDVTVGVVCRPEGPLPISASVQTVKRTKKPGRQAENA